MSNTTDQIYAFGAKNIQGTEESLSKYRGKVLLVVNVASKCGFTPQYTGLEKIYRQFKDQGFEILGFPCNQFGAQEPGDEKEIQSFCSLNYEVSFPMFSKVDVNGPNTHPLYAFMKSKEKGIFGTEGIKWNFTKFLISRKGEVISRFAPQTKPEELAVEIKKALQEKA